MTKTIYTGEELAEALFNGSFEHAPGSKVLEGLIKKSDDKDSVAFTISGCDTWVDIPTNMIQSAEYVGFYRCRDHSHPKVKLTLLEPTNADAKVILSLLLQSVSGLMLGSTTSSDNIYSLNSTKQGFPSIRMPNGKPLYLAARRRSIGFEDEDGCFYAECGNCNMSEDSFGILYCLQSSEQPNSPCVDSFCLTITLGPGTIINRFHR